MINMCEIEAYGFDYSTTKREYQAIPSTISKRGMYHKLNGYLDA
jgi:hypothetical protein